MPKKDNTIDLIVKQPVHDLNKKIKFSYKDLFINLGKISIATEAGKPATALRHGMDLFKSVELEEKPEWVAWSLISKALTKTLFDLVEDYKDLFQKELAEEEFESIALSVEDTLNAMDVSIDANFFGQPQKLPLLEDFKRALVYWLKELDWDDAQAEAFHTRMKSSFVFALNDIWASNPEDYKILEKRLVTPFTDASLEQRNWIRYTASLAELSNERVFNEAFSLKQVYVPLNAYYEETIIDDEDNEKTKKIAFDLHDYINNWVINFDKENALKVVSGGPGCGKSSFSKMLVSEIATKNEIPVLFVPLHQFDPTKDLIKAVEEFISRKTFPLGNPLDTKTGQERLLIIFDGLDELSMKSQEASEIAENFVHEVNTELHRFNTQGLKRQAIITGRDLAVQASKQRLRKSQQVLHMLPYYLSKNEQKKFQDKDQKLTKDLRNVWWKKFGKAKGNPYKGLPKELKKENLIPITREPLLNYLVALSFQRKEVDFDETTTLNTIYEDLLEAVYERQWGDEDQFALADHLKKSEFFRILEEIALAVWHGHGRTASQSAIYKRCNESGLKGYLDKFSDGAEKGVVRLLTAFYFREFGQESSGDRIFEFTHKSFGEYLTARRIVREVENIQDEVERHQKNPDKGYNIRKALEVWARICGTTAMDDYLFGFVKNEIASNDLKDIKKWQKVFAEMLGSTIRHTMPMEKLGLNNFEEMLRQSRNSEEAILAIYNSCFKVTQKIIKIDWGELTAFGVWWKRVQGQRSGGDNPLASSLLSGLDLSRVYLYNLDFYDANLSDLNLDRGHLILAILVRANLSGSNLMAANLNEANLNDANLEEANLEEANLEEANLIGANLIRANLEGANLKRANLKRANLERANLERANLERANLEGANLERANLERANLKRANLKRANLEGTILDKK